MGCVQSETLVMDTPSGATQSTRPATQPGPGQHGTTKAALAADNSSQVLLVRQKQTTFQTESEGLQPAATKILKAQRPKILIDISIELQPRRSRHICRDVDPCALESEGGPQTEMRHKNEDPAER